jgi:subtilase family serine protease
MTIRDYALRSFLATIAALSLGALPAVAARPIDGFEAHPPIHVKGPINANRGSGGTAPLVLPGFSPASIKAAYNLPATGGAGATIAIVDAYDNPRAESDLNTFSTQFGLPSCTTGNGCFKKVTMMPRLRSNQGWALEESLDVQWAHAIAPSAKILLVEAKSASGNDLLAAVDYARAQPGVVAVSMSWGGNEFAGEAAYDSHFTGTPAFFASSGDSGAGVSWPAVSANVVGVGGTTLTSTAETAWSGSGGGVSSYVSKPSYQSGIVGTMRSVPDVSYDADPNTGFPVYDSYGYQGFSGWFLVGGTSAGAPQWAAIHAIGHTATNSTLYADAAVPATYAAKFRDIISGSNGLPAGVGYDLVTGLGSPLTTAF